MVYLIDKGYIPYSKSWTIRMAFLDLISGRAQDSIHFLENQNQEDLPEDLKSLKQGLYDMVSGKRTVYGGESGTWLRCIITYTLKFGLSLEIITAGTLQERKIYGKDDVLEMTPEQRLKLDGGTTQWESPAYMLGVSRKIENPKPKLKLTYEAVDHWQERRKKNELWEPRRDETILGQALAFLDLLKDGKTNWEPTDSEDYCFGRTFDKITKEEAQRRWSSLAEHESNRFKEMEKVLEQAEKDLEMDSRDHRPIQAYAMLQKLRDREIKVKHRKAVNKSWPQFWRFLEDSDGLHL